MKSITDFTDLELDDQIYNARKDMEEAETQGDYNAGYAEFTVAKIEKQRRACNCDTCDLKGTCQYLHKFQRLPRVSGGLGLCKRLEEVD